MATAKKYVLPTRIEVNRAKWRFGGNAFNYNFGDTALRNSQGYQCCLGFAAQAAGVSITQITGMATPEELGLQVEGLTRADGLCWYDTPLSDEAAIINDEDLDLRAREELLSALFKKHGYELVFEGKYTKKQLRVGGL